MKGNTGKIINVNLTTGQVEIESLPEDYYRKYIGGSGLAAKLFWDRVDFSLDPLAPEALLLFMNGPLAGIRLSGASRNSLAGCSPLTGHWGDSSCGGYLAPELRYAGFDGLIITGRAARSSFLLIVDNRITIEAGEEYWGQGTEKVTKALKTRFGKDYRTLVIGPAAENGVKYTIILNDGHHATGRAGFGTLLGSMDLAATCKAGRICNDLGMDTISCGSTIAWAMEAFERGDLTLEGTGGLELKWGDLDTVVNRLLPAIARREGPLGELLADGSVAAAKKIGKGMDYLTHSKGLEAPMHDPRGGGQGMALTYAVSPRGACHVADPMMFMELGGKYYPEIGFELILDPKSTENKALAATTSVALGAIENSACFCNFADGEVTIPDWLHLFNFVVGYDWIAEDMMLAGRRIFYLKRLINYRYGLTAADDDLTPRMKEPARDGEAEGVQVDLDTMKAEFYVLMGMDPEKGIPTKAALEEAGMTEEAKKVWG